MNEVWLFPGQGSQFVGMGQDLYDQYPLVSRRYEEAAQILNIDLAQISFYGPAELLTRTENTQPAIFVHSLVLAELLKKRGYTPSAVAGHSLGEFTALVTAGALNFEDALKIIGVRSREMANAGDKQAGAMAAVIGATAEQVDIICDQDKIVVPANLNAPGQVVISGDEEGIKTAMLTAKEIGVRRVIPLKVSGAFHSPLMRPARDALADIITKCHFTDAQIPVYQNVSAEPVITADTLQHNILEQLESPVRWADTILNMSRDGHNDFLEVGPGTVLQGLVKKSLSGAAFSGIGTAEQLQNYGY